MVRAIGFGVVVTLTAVVFVVALRRNGLHALVTGRKIRRAAVGRARRAWGVIPAHSRTMVGDALPASELIARLRQERAGLRTA